MIAPNNAPKAQSSRMVKKKPAMRPAQILALEARVAGGGAAWGAPEAAVGREDPSGVAVDWPAPGGGMKAGAGDVIF